MVLKEELGKVGTGTVMDGLADEIEDSCVELDEVKGNELTRELKSELTAAELEEPEEIVSSVHVNLDVDSSEDKLELTSALSEVIPVEELSEELTRVLELAVAEELS